jgi:hypothetical protein
VNKEGEKDESLKIIVGRKRRERRRLKKGRSVIRVTFG